MKKSIIKSASILVGIAAFALINLDALAQEQVLFMEYQGELENRQQSIINNLNNKETTKRLRVAQMDTSAFQNTRIVANLFADHSPLLEYSDIGHSGVKFRTWTGLTANALGSAAFVINGNRISGHVVSTEGNYEIFPLGNEGVHAIVEHDDSKFRPCGMGPEGRPSPRFDSPDDQNDNDLGLPNRPAEDQQRSVIGEECFVRVVVGYTSLAQTNTDDDFGRTMIEHISLAVTESNQGYANSDVDMRMELAYLYEVTDVETANACNDVDDLQDTDDGKWDEIHSHRSNYDGDMVCLITGGLYATNPNCNPNGGLCGLAFEFDYTDPTNMFQVTEYDCATGNYTFAHEFGHTQGARHDNDNTGTPFSYARGYNEGVNFRTIMAVCCTPVRVNFWSNPDIDHPSCNCATGTATRDNARALDVGDATVAHHRETPATFVTGITIGNDEWLNMLASTELTSTNDAASGSLLQLKSFTKVTLAPGFHAFTGSEGRYYIAPTCPGVSYSFTENDNQQAQVIPDADGTIPGKDHGNDARRRPASDPSHVPSDGQKDQVGDIQNETNRLKRENNPQSQPDDDALQKKDQ